MNSLLALQATDVDTTKNVQYQFAGGESSAFSIDPLSGSIRTTQALDYISKNLYIFQVTTSDGTTSGALAATATVTVSVVVCSLPLSFGKLQVNENKTEIASLWGRPVDVL